MITPNPLEALDLPLETENTAPAIDRFIFSGGLLLLVGIVLAILIAPQQSAAVIDSMYVAITTRFGVLFIVAAIATLCFLLYIAVSRHGNLVLDSDGDRTDLRRDHLRFGRLYAGGGRRPESLLFFVLDFDFGAVDEFDPGHGSAVAVAIAAFEDADVAAGAILVTRTEFGEELAHGGLVAHAAEGQTAIGYAVFLCQRDERFGDGAQFLRLCQRRLDDFVFHQRRGHVAKHGGAMCAVPAETAAAFSMTHLLNLFIGLRRFLASGDSSPQATRSSDFSRAGGQFSSRRPSESPRVASTSLISVRDFLPRLGVRSNSTSERWIRSPM